MGELLAGGMALEGRILAEGQRLREASKQAYGSELLDARACGVAVFSRLLQLRDSIPGNTDDSISDRLTLTSTFVQGIPATETFISEGQYAKAAAVLKQDYETVARLAEVREGKAKKGKTPQAKMAPEGSQPVYGELNKIAHPSNEDILTGLLMLKREGEVAAVSPVPKFNAHVAKGLYGIHVTTILWVAREAIYLDKEMYPDLDEDLVRVADLYCLASDLVARDAARNES